MSSHFSTHLLLADNRESFAARLAVIERAQKSICVQTYLLHDDDTGRLFLSALCAAADRGVNVQLLLDDIDVFAREDLLLYLAEHQHFELRLFNPFAGRRFPRWSRFISLLFDHGHFGRRMHNKVLIVDNELMIVGGRNIGNAYFDAPAGVNFFDLDVMIKGAVVASAQQSFECYWNHPCAIPIQQLHPTSLPQKVIKRQRKRLQNWLRHKPLETVDWLTLQQTFVAQRFQRSEEWHSASAEWVADTPEKIIFTRRHRNDSPSGKLFNLLSQTQKKAILVSPYFVPRRRGAALLSALARSGVEVSILTNSLAATDVPLVHGGYERYRRRLLASGIKLFELKPTTQMRSSWQSLRVSHASLHAKSYVFDTRYIFIGSLNLDPRSLSINTECGVIIDCTTLAQKFETLFIQATDGDFSYRLSLKENKVQWQENEVVHKREPQVSNSRKLLALLARALPIEAQL